MEEMTIYGKLFELADHDPAGEEETKGFWGQLCRDNGEIWRIQFKPDDLATVTPLFRKQVVITGTAVYYRVASPKIIVRDISPEHDRDYEAAFDNLFGCDKALYNADFQTLLRRMRGDE
jgi:hypothetical protein